MQNRPPIVVILGHVDHGKTTLLDYLRKTSVVSREAGGITQHISSFQHEFQIHNSKFKSTFIDTPGHAAFSNIRSRGSKIADIAILVVAAGDGVMPQTKESIQFIKDTKVPFIVALTKSDLDTASPDRVKTQLTETDVIVEDYGGTVPCVSISSKTGAGIPDLLEMIDLVNSMNPAQADPDSQLEAVVLESSLDPKKGPLATVIVRSGTLSVGQSLFQKSQVGKVRSLIDSDGKQIKSALPSTPVEIIGLSEVLEVGSVISTAPLSGHPEQREGSRKLYSSSSTQNDKKINLILKSDVLSSQEAILGSLPPGVNVVSYSTGDINETDVATAQSSGATILAFNVKAPSGVAKLAEVDHVTIKSFKIIYELLDAVDKMFTPEVVETVLGKATVAAEFKINADRIAGARCTEGVISRGDQIKIQRGETVVGSTRLKSLRTSKTEIPSVKSGGEFGAVFSPYVDFKVGDIIIAVKVTS